MAKWGINPKDWFYGFRDDLQERSEHVRARLAGAAAEQWINAEFFAFLSKFLDGDRRFYVYPEWKKLDMAVFRQHEHHDKTDEHDPIEAIVEAKLFYRGYAKTKTRAYVAKLGEQLDNARALMIEDSVDGHVGKCVGLVFAAYVKWPERFDGRKNRATSGEFKRYAGSLIRSSLPKRVKVAKETLETLVEEGKTKIGSVEVDVGLYGQYVTLD